MQCPDNGVIYTHTRNKLLEIEWEHILYTHVANRFRAQVFQFYAQQRTAQDVTIRTVIHQKLNCRNNIGTLLYFVEKDERFTLDERHGGDCR